MNFTELAKNAELVSKITTKTVCEDLRALVKDKDNGTNIPLMRIVGNATSMKSGVSNYGEWTKLLGDFICISLLDSKATRSAQLIMPNVAQNLVTAAMMSADTANAAFAFDVIVEVSEKSSVGYTFKAASLIAPSESDPLLMLASQISAPMPQLAIPAPSKKGK